MTPEGHNDLFPAIESALRNADEPLDCNQLFRMPDINAVAPSANRVSDYLGIYISEEGEHINIELPHLSITIKKK